MTGLTDIEGLEDFERIVRKERVLVPASYAPILWGVNRSRVYQLIEAGRVPGYRFFGGLWVPVRRELSPADFL